MKTIKIIPNWAWEIMPPEKKLKILKRQKLFDWDYNLKQDKNYGRFCDIQPSN